MTDPLVSIVTPVYNEAGYIEENIRSIRDQGYDNIEHIIVDGGSDDGTVDIIKSHEASYDLRWVSESDGGMYEAIEKGFDLADGGVYAWLNGDDMYLPWAVETAVEYLQQDGVDWVTGVPGTWDGDGRLRWVESIRTHYKRSWIRRGWYHPYGLGTIQQESLFWTAALWELKGGFPESVAGAPSADYYLWRKFAEAADLVTMPTVVSGFRDHEEGQLSDDMAAYVDPIDDFPGMDTPNETVLGLLETFYVRQLYSAFQIALANVRQ